VALHLYGVVADAARPPEELRGRDDQPLLLVVEDGLAAVVSEVDAQRPAGAKDLVAHARVLEAYAAEGTVIPMQFGIALPDEEAVREQLLRVEGPSLHQLLATFEGWVQVTVQAFQEEDPALREVLRRDPALTEEREALRLVPEPARQAREVELGQAVAGGLQQLEEEDRAMLLDRLAPLAGAVAESDPAALHQVLNAAFLVERAHRGAFDAEVTAISEETAEWLRLRYVGPQPPYSFLEPVRNGELVWA